MHCNRSLLQISHMEDGKSLIPVTVFYNQTELYSSMKCIIIRMCACRLVWFTLSIIFKNLGRSVTHPNPAPINNMKFLYITVYLDIFICLPWQYCLILRKCWQQLQSDGSGQFLQLQTFLDSNSVVTSQAVWKDSSEPLKSTLGKQIIIIILLPFQSYQVEHRIGKLGHH